MVVESIGITLLFPSSDLQNPRLETSESCKHTVGSYRIVEIYFTVDRLMQLEDMNWRKKIQCTKVT